MRRRLLLLIVLMLVVPVEHIVLAQTPQNGQFTIRAISLNGVPAYDMRIAPDGRTAALFVGSSAAILLGIPPVEYVPDPRALPIRLIDLTTGQELGQLTGQTDYASDIAFTPDSQQMASYQRNGEIDLWDISGKRLIKRLSSLVGGGFKLHFLPDGKTLLVEQEGGLAGHFMTWDLETGSITTLWHKPIASFGELKTTMPDNMDASYSASDLSPDGTLLATASRTGEIALWDMATLQQTVLKTPPADHDQKLKALLGIPMITFSADGKLLIYYDSLTSQTHFWDVAAHTETKAVAIGSRYWGLSPKANALVWVSDNHKELWFAKVDQPDGATKIMDFPENLDVTPTVVFTAENTVVVGGFFVQDQSQDNSLFVITMK